MLLEEDAWYQDEKDGAEKIYKIIVVGDVGSGKTSIIRRMVNRELPMEAERSLLGADFVLKSVQLARLESFSLELWDVPGVHDAFERRKAAYLKDLAGVFVVMDCTAQPPDQYCNSSPTPSSSQLANSKFSNFYNKLTNSSTHSSDLQSALTGANVWKDACEEEFPNIPCVLLLNKVDLFRGSHDSLQRLDTSGYIATLATSAKNGQNIDEAIKVLAKLIVSSTVIPKSASLQPGRARFAANSIVYVESGERRNKVLVKVKVKRNKNSSELVISVRPNKKELNLGQSITVKHSEIPGNRMLIRDRRGHIILMEVANLHIVVESMKWLKSEAGIQVDIVPLTYSDQYTNLLTLSLKIAAHRGLSSTLISQLRACTAANSTFHSLYLQHQTSPHIHELIAPCEWYSYLTHLDLSYTQLELQSFESILVTTTNGKALRSIKLRKCGLHSSLLSQKAVSCFTTPSLEILDIAENMLCDADLNLILEAIQNSTLKDLDFSYNPFSQKICDSLVVLISHNATLRRIALVNEKKIASGINKIIVELLLNTTITSLDLGISNLTQVQQQNIYVILRRNSTYPNINSKRLNTITDLEGLHLPFLELIDDSVQILVDQFNFSGKIKFDITIIKIVGNGAGILPAKLEISRQTIQIISKMAVYMSIPVSSELKIGLLAQPPMFGILCNEDNKIKWFKCAQYLGLLGVLRKVVPHCFVPRFDNLKLHGLELISSGTFEMYSAKYGGQSVGLKVLSKVPLSDEIKGNATIPPELFMSRESPYVSFLNIEANPLVVIATDTPSQTRTLAHFICESANYDWDVRLAITISMAEAMRFLHLKKIVHGCLVPTDFLVLSTNVDAPVHIRLADFGLTRKIDVSSIYAHDIVQWVAPEALHLGTFENPSDVYSFGIIMWQMTTGKQNPYETMMYSSNTLVDYVVSGGRPASPSNNDAPSAFVALILSCLLQNPSSRPTFDDILTSLRTIAAQNKKLRNDEAPQNTNASPRFTRKPVTDVTSFRQSRNLSTSASLRRAHAPGIVNEEGDLQITDLAQLKSRDTWKKLERGATATVYIAECANSTKKIAVKEIDIAIRNERQFMAHINQVLPLSHPNIVRHHGVCRPGYPLIFMEYVQNGNLYDALRDPQKRVAITWESSGIKIARDIITGLKFLHELNPPIVHCDMKSANILLDLDWRAKIADLDTSRIRNSAFLTTRSSTRTTLQYKAPEVYHNEHLNEKLDIYSVGVVIWEILTQKIPWDGMNEMRIMNAVTSHQRLPIPATVPQNIQMMLNKCWAADPQQRPTATEILQELQ